MASTHDGSNRRGPGEAADGVARAPDGEPRSQPLTRPRTTPPPMPPPPGVVRTQPQSQRPANEPKTVAVPNAASARRRRLLLMPLRWCGNGMLIVVPLVLLLGGLVYAKLMFGSIPLRFVVGPIRHALSSQLEGMNVGIGDATLSRDDDGSVQLRLTGLELSSNRGGRGLSAAEATVGLDTSALWSGRLAASRIVLIGPRFILAKDDAGTGQATPAGSSEIGTAATPAGRGATPGAGDGGRQDGGGVEAQRFDMARVLAGMVAQLRRSGEAASHVKSLGLRNATFEVDDRGHRSTWLVPNLVVGLDHRQKRSVVTGEGNITALVTGGPALQPFAVAFRLDEAEKTRTLRLETRITGLRPNVLAKALPHLGLFGGVDVPLDGRGEIELTSGGEMTSGRFDISLGRGLIAQGALGGLAVGVDGGNVTLLYNGHERRLEVAPSTVQLDGSWIKMAGLLVPVPGPGGHDRSSGWQLDLNSIEGAIATQRDAAALPIERLALSARLWPEAGETELVSFGFKAGGAELTAEGRLVGGERGGATVDGRVGPMTVETIKAIWPRGLLPEVRDPLFRALVKGQVKGGSFKVRTSTEPQPGSQPLSAVLEAEDLAIASVQGVPPVSIPRALATLTGTRLELAIPDATLTAAANRRVSIKGGQIIVNGIDQPRPEAEISGRATTTLATLGDLAQREQIGLLKPGQMPAGTDGKIEAQWRVVTPVAGNVAIADTKLDAKVRLSEGRIANVLGNHDVTGAGITIGATEKSVDVKGEFLLAGILAKVGGQWLIGEARERQPIVISTRLDNADRRQLGLTIDDIVQGEIPIEIQVTPPTDGEAPKVQFNADLTGAELTLDGIDWKKPSGRMARLSFDAVKQKTGKAMELQNFRVAGDGIAIDGTVTIGADGDAQSFKFPGFSLNVISNLEVEGQRGAEKLWTVKARGKTFDGGDMMRALYAVDTSLHRRKRDGYIDIEARIDTVLGVNDTTIKGVKLHMRRRGDVVQGLEFSGMLDTGQAIEARLESTPGAPHVVHVTTKDTGQALKTIGFYSSMLGGKGDLWVNLDGRGTAEKAGQIQIGRFQVLGDPIVEELIQGAEDNRPAIAAGSPRKRKMVREQIQFDVLRGSFATGNAQVAVESLAAAGPLLGISFRGKLDFRSKAVSLGGTYVPLSGLNRALAGIPLVGEILTGPKGDGIFGITFAVDGAMSQPNVIINPLSLVAPGLLREIFQMAPDNPTVTPMGERQRAAPAPAASTGARVRSSQPEAYKGASGPASEPKVLDGWSSQAYPSKQK